MEPVLRLHRRLAYHGPKTRSERLLFIVLKPFSVLYGLIGLLRVWFYRTGVFKVYRAPVPVISVGNLSVGGTGKTPAVDYLLKLFSAEGIPVACVSRGYGGQGIEGVGVVCRGNGPLLEPSECGDEPYLLARRNPSAMVLVSRRRRDGVRRAVEEFGAKIVVLDDGFQHLAVARDLDIVLIDGRNPLGNACPVPAGPLREFPSALRRGDLFLATRCSNADLSLPQVDSKVWRSCHVLDNVGISLDGERASLKELAGKKGVAFAGIADPAAFFEQLEQVGLELSDRIFLPDHESYDPQTLKRLQHAGQHADFLITTEKDGVKLQGQKFPGPCYQVPMTLQIEDEQNFRQTLQKKLQHKRSLA